MKRQADLQRIEKDKRNKTGTDEGNPEKHHPGLSRICTMEKRTHQTDEGETGTASLYGQSRARMTNSYIDWNASISNPQMYLRPSFFQQGLIASHQGYVPIYDPIRAQMTTSNNGRNTPAFTQQMHPHPSMLQGALGASYPHYNAIAYSQQMMMQPTTPHYSWTQWREQHFNPARVFSVGHREYQTGRAQAENSDATAYNRQAMMQASTSHPLQDPTIEKGLDQTDKEKAGSGTGVTVHQATNVYHVIGGTVDNRHMLPQPSTSETELNAATRRTIAGRHEAIQRFRKILKDYDSRECNGRVTEDYDELTEPTEEVSPKLLWLLKFYQGDLLKMMSQYQRDPSFTDKRKAASSGKELDYKTFLRHIMETETKRISVIAQAGSGKTVMLKRLARDLAKHNDELLIFFMNFRDFTYSKDITPCDFLINGRLSDSDAKHSYEWILENQDKVMLVLDGLDQANWDIDENAASIGSYGRGKVSEIVSSLFKRKLFPGVKVVYSSREHAVASLGGKLRPEMVVALTGLSSDDSEWLFKSFLCEEGEILWEKLRTQSHSLIPLLSIPAFLVFTAIVYVNKPENPPRSMTEVLKNLLEIFMQSGHIVKKDVSMVLTGLKKMSFVGMKDGKVLFYIENVRNAGLDPEQICDWIITIPGLNKCNQFLLEGHYVLMFSHQTIQEFLVAQYIIEEGFESFKKIVNQYLKKSSWSVVARFVSGLLLNDEISADLDKDPDIELKKTVLKEMLKKKYEGLKISSPELLATIFESNCDDFIRDLLQGKKLDVRRLGDSDAYIIGSAMRHLTCLNELRFQSCSLRHETLQIIWNLIENSSLKISKLDLTYIKFESEASTIAGKLIKKCSVNELSLSNCDITNQVFEKLLPDGKIMKLNFSKTKLDAETFVMIGDIVGRCSAVELTMRYCELAGASLTIDRSSSTGMKTLKLKLLGAELEDIEYTALGKIVKTLAVDELELQCCDLTDGKLKNLMIEVDGAKILKIDVAYNGGMEDKGYATLGKIVKMCAVDELLLQGCELSDGKLKNLLSETNGAKISKLDISNNRNMEDKGYTTLGKIVKMCAVDQLLLRECGLSDGKLKNFLSETNGAKISKIDIYNNRDMEDKGYATLGKIAKMCAVDQLLLRGGELSDGKLKNFLSETDGAKISKLNFSDVKLDIGALIIIGDIVQRCSVEELTMFSCKLAAGSLTIECSSSTGTKTLKLDLHDTELEEIRFAALGKIVKMCAVDQFFLHSCNLTDGKLKNLMIEVEGAKISKLDVSYNILNEATAAVLGDIVKRCSVEELSMKVCGLNDGSLKTLLSRCSGAKLSSIDVRSIYVFSGEHNHLSSALLDEIGRSITVKRY